MKKLWGKIAKYEDEEEEDDDDEEEYESEEAELLDSLTIRRELY